MPHLGPSFLLGAATAAHQVEGNNTHSDSWAKEQMPHSGFAEPSGDALDHYHRYEEDILLLKAAGLNAYRFSIEWARIEPEEGRFDENEAEHYRRVIRFCRENGVEPIVTLHHFTSPLWLIQKGGWEADTTPGDFARYAAYVTRKLGSELNWVCTINEANMGIEIASVAKKIMRRMRSVGKIQAGLILQDIMKRNEESARENLEVFGTESPAVFLSPRTAHGDEIVQAAHREARSAIKAAAPHIRVGWTLSLHDIQAVPGGEEAAAREWEREFRHYLPTMMEDDFLGIQNYTRTVFGADGSLPMPEDAEKTQMNYEFYPEALEHVIRKVHEDFRGDLIVTENGVATANDARRVAFIEQALAGVRRCLQDGVPVRGYCHWSLLDNFEWQKGYSMTFGLIAVDRKTQERHPKESLYALGQMR